MFHLATSQTGNLLWVQEIISCSFQSPLGNPLHTNQQGISYTSQGSIYAEKKAQYIPQLKFWMFSRAINMASHHLCLYCAFSNFFPVIFMKNTLSVLVTCWYPEANEIHSWLEHRFFVLVDSYAVFRLYLQLLILFSLCYSRISYTHSKVPERKHST